MIGEELKVLAGQISIYVSGGLLWGRVQAHPVRRRDFRSIAENFRSDGEKRRIAVNHRCNSFSARLTVIKMIGYRQQFRRA